MMEKTFMFNWKGYSLPTSEATIEYLSDRSEPARWDDRVRNLSCFGADVEDLDLEKGLDTFMDRYESEGTNASDVNAFLDRTRTVFNHLNEDPESVIDQLFPDHHFVFILGLPGMGGLQVLKTLWAANGFDPTSLTPGMVGEVVPSPEHALQFEEPDPLHEYNFLYGLAQFFVWVKTAIDRNPFVVKQSSSLLGALPFLLENFEDRVTILVPYRPAEVFVENFQQRFEAHAAEPTLSDTAWNRLRDRPEAPGEDDSDARDSSTKTVEAFDLWEGFYRRILRGDAARESIRLYSANDPGPVVESMVDEHDLRTVETSPAAGSSPPPRNPGQNHLTEEQRRIGDELEAALGETYPGFDPGNLRVTVD